MKRILRLFSAGEVRKDYADSADLFRVLCVLLIAWFHIWQQSWLNPNFTAFGKQINIYPIVTCGYIFVDCMLLLSGFLLMLGYLNGRYRSRNNFYVSRVGRIVPCYYLFLLFQLIFFILPCGGFGALSNGIIDILSHLTFTQNLFREGYIGTKFNGVLWTLAVECQFYLIFPYLGKAFKRHPIRIWVLMTAFGFLARFYIARYYSDITLYFNRLTAMMDVYANGMMAAVIWKKLSRRKPNTLIAWLNTLLMIASCWAIYQLAAQQRMFSDYHEIRVSQMNIRFALSIAAAVFLISAGRSILLVRKLFSNPITRFISGISFNFYMWHQFLAVQLKQWHIPDYASESPNMNGEMPWQITYTILCFVAAMAISALLTYLVEKPCSALIKRRFPLDKREKIGYNSNSNHNEQKG